jgi:hypothetical protein
MLLVKELRLNKQWQQYMQHEYFLMPVLVPEIKCFSICCAVWRCGAGGTQKLLLGEPTMMPNWDRDAEVSPSPLSSLDACLLL